MKKDTIIQHYKILSPIGKGGMGEVYLAQDTKLDRKVAIKFLNEEFSKDADKLGRFIQEAKAASALNHPNILTVYEIGEADGRNYIATELIEGKTLREHLSHKESLQLNQILKIGVQVAEALSAAHHAGIIHRDIKPENIMIRKDGYAKVLDFGLAKLSEPPASVGGTAANEDATRMQVNTTPGMVMGTVSYMSPEQARGNPTDARTDIWSLGIVLYEMCAGKVPFTGETVNHTIVSILEKEPLLLENVPDELQRIVRKSLTKDVDMRYQSAHDLLIDLKNLRRDLDIKGELERSVVPNRATVTETSSENATQFYTADAEATRSGQAAATQNVTTSSSSLEYAITQAKSRKMVAAIIGLLLISAISAVAYFGFFARSNAKQIESIAVMPFVNDSGNADVEYLADGLTETLIGSLSKLSELSVKARSAVFAYKGQAVSAKQIGEDLGVQAVLLGRLVQRGESIKLNLELVNAKTLDVIWSEQYDRKQADLVKLQSEIARDVSSKLKQKLTGADQQKLAKSYTNDPEAYRLYLQGRFYLKKRVGKEYEKALGFLQQALARDPNFALGLVGLAEFIDDDDRPRAKEYILRALAIDNDLSEAHAAYGYQLALDRDWAAAEREITRAIELDPRNASAHQSNGTRLMFIGRHQECLAAYDRAIELEPTFADIRVNRGMCIAAAGRLDDGIAEVKKAIEIDPSYPWAHSALSFLYRMKGDQAASVEARARSAELVDRPDLAKRLRDTFRERRWRAYLQELFDQTAGLFPNLVRRASILCELDRPDEAMIALEQSAAKGEWWLFIVKVDPAFDPLRGDPRFQAILRQFDPPK